jgi:hypothetical protein
MQSLYVCVFSNGIVKVGRGINPQERIRAHRSTGEAMGVDMVNHCIAECQGDIYSAERELISWCVEQCTKRMRSEWFLGVDYAQAVEKAKEFAANAQVKTTKERAQDTGFCDALRDTFFLPDEIQRREREQWQRSLLLANVACHMLVCGSHMDLEICEPQERLGGISCFELLAAIAMHKLSMEYTAELMMTVANAVDNPIAISALVKHLSTTDDPAKQKYFAKSA